MDEPIFDPVTYALLKSQLKTDNIQNDSEYVTGEDLTAALDSLNGALTPETVTTYAAGADLPSGSTVTVKKMGNLVSIVIDCGSNRIAVSSPRWFNLLTLPNNCKPSAQANANIIYQQYGATGVLCQNGQITTSGVVRVYLNPTLANDVAYLTATAMYIL